MLGAIDIKYFFVHFFQCSLRGILKAMRLSVSCVMNRGGKEGLEGIVYLKDKLLLSGINNNIMDLQKAYERFKDIPFPDDSSTSEVLSDILSEIVLYDMFIAGNVDAMLSGDKGIIMETDAGLEKRVNEFFEKENLSEPDLQAALKVKEYLNEINLLVQVAQKHL